MGEVNNVLQVEIWYLLLHFASRIFWFHYQNLIFYAIVSNNKSYTVVDPPRYIIDTSPQSTLFKVPNKCLNWFPYIFNSPRKGQPLHKGRNSWFDIVPSASFVRRLYGSSMWMRNYTTYCMGVGPPGLPALSTACDGRWERQKVTYVK